MMARLCRDSLRGIQIINLIELNRTLAQLRLSGMATVLETRLLQAQSEAMIPIDMISILVSDELECRNCWSDATNDAVS
jgi:hypothetical protein